MKEKVDFLFALLLGMSGPTESVAFASFGGGIKLPADPRLQGSETYKNPVPYYHLRVVDATPGQKHVGLLAHGLCKVYSTREQASKEFAVAFELFHQLHEGDVDIGFRNDERPDAADGKPVPITILKAAVSTWELFLRGIKDSRRHGGQVRGSRTDLAGTFP